MAAHPYFVALEPAALLAEHLWRYKRRVWSLVGDQVFLAHPPHSTLYVALFPNGEQLLRAVEDLAEEFTQLPVRISRWHVYEADALTGGHTLVCPVEAEFAMELRRWQQRVIETLAPLRDVAATRNRYLARWAALSGAQQQAVVEYGFPYVGPGWQPHLTVASIATQNWPSVAADLLPESPALTSTWQSIQVYELRHEEPHLSAAFPLGQGVPAP